MKKYKVIFTFTSFVLAEDEDMAYDIAMSQFSADFNQSDVNIAIATDEEQGEEF